MGLNIRVIAPDGLIWNTPVARSCFTKYNRTNWYFRRSRSFNYSLEIGVLRIKVDQTWKPILSFRWFCYYKK